MVSSILTKEMQELVKPDENMMFRREGFDRESLRAELADTVQVDNSVKYITQGNTSFISENTSMPGGPTTEGESFGSVELVREVGGTQMVPRYTHGLTIMDEDLEVPEMAQYITEERQTIMNLFNLQADVAFFKGMSGPDGTEIFPGVFEWVDNNIDANNVIDCSNYDMGTGDLSGIPANVVLRIAYSKASGRYVTTTWDVAVAKHEVWSLWNEVGRADYNVNQSQWSLMQADDAGVGVNRRMLLPDEIGYPAATGQAEKFKFSLDFPAPTSADDGVGDIAPADDVMYLLPEHNMDFFHLVEAGTPDVRGPIVKEGFRERWEYKWKAGVVYGQSHRANGEAVDVVKLENVESLFQ